MAEATTIESAPPADAGTVLDTPLSLSQGDEAIAALFGDLDEDQAPAESHEGNPADTPPDEAEPESPDEVDDGTLSEDSDNPDDTTDPDEPSHTDGQFVPDGGKVKMPDGRTLSVAELKEFADTRAKELQSGVSKKIAEVVEQENALKARDQEVSQRAERLEKEREFIASFVEAYVPQPPQEPTVDATVDPVAWSVYAQQKLTFDKTLADWKQAEQLKKDAEAERYGQTLEQQKKFADEQRTKFFETFPSLKDDGKRAAFWERNVKQAQDYYGFSKEEVLGITDVRLVKALNDANAYRALKAKTPEAQTRLAAKPTLVNGSGKRSNPDAVAKRGFADQVGKLQKTGDVRVADKILEAFID